MPNPVEICNLNNVQIQFCTYTKRWAGKIVIGVYSVKKTKRNQKTLPSGTPLWFPFSPSLLGCKILEKIEPKEPKKHKLNINIKLNITCVMSTHSRFSRRFVIPCVWASTAPEGSIPSTFWDFQCSLHSLSGYSPYNISNAFKCK